jgi:hypothetical protein
MRRSKQAMKRDSFNNILAAVNRKNGVDTLTCSFCGKVKNEITFLIGGNVKDAPPEWVMIAGSGKVACPDCYAEHQGWTEPKPERIVIKPA